MRKAKRHGLALLLALGLAGCVSSPDGWLLARYGSHNTTGAFVICKNYGCKAQVMVSLRPSEWQEVRAAFTPAAVNAAEEREQVRRAIALLETLVGPKAGTDHDEAGAPIFNLARDGQLDCIDEAYNTTTYLRLMATDGLLKWHDVGQPAERGYFLNRWPHNTATLIEHGSSTAYTVDSWFHANGEMPETVLLKDWLDGWSPAKS